jgi:hypothetical protein
MPEEDESCELEETTDKEPLAPVILHVEVISPPVPERPDDDVVFRTPSEVTGLVR